MLDCHPSHWRYLGEGGANIVFEYLGGDVDLVHNEASKGAYLLTFRKTKYCASASFFPVRTITFRSQQLKSTVLMLTLMNAFKLPYQKTLWNN